MVPLISVVLGAYFCRIGNIAQSYGELGSIVLGCCGTPVPLIHDVLVLLVYADFLAINLSIMSAIAPSPVTLQAVPKLSIEM